MRSMKRAHEAQTKPSTHSSVRDDGASSPDAPPPRKKAKDNDPPGREENRFVQSVLRSIEDRGGEDGSDDDLESCVGVHLSKLEGEPNAGDWRGRRPKRLRGKSPGPGATLDAISVFYSIERDTDGEGYSVQRP